ncbi:MAG: RraA family protein, partial [Anaerolineae bacterium]
AIHAVNVPVSVAGMDVAPGEIIHMDENGAVKFPARYLAEVLDRVTQLRDREAEHMSALRAAKSAAEVRAILGGGHYGKK